MYSSWAGAGGVLGFGQDKLLPLCSGPCRHSPGLLYRLSPVGLQKEAAASTPCSATDREAEKPLKLLISARTANNSY